MTAHEDSGRRLGSLWTANVPCAADGDQTIRLVPGGDLHIGRAQRPSGVEASGDDTVWRRSGKAQKVAAKVDRDPPSGACMLDRVPAGGVDTGRERPAVKERPGDRTTERARRWIEPQDDGVREQLDGDEADGGIER